MGPETDQINCIEGAFEKIQKISTNDPKDQKKIQMLCGSDHWKEMKLADKGE